LRLRVAGERHWPSLFASALLRRAAHRDCLPLVTTPRQPRLCRSRLWGVFCFQESVEVCLFFRTHHSHVGNARSSRGVCRIFFWRLDVVCDGCCRRGCGRRGLWGHGWRTWRRGRDICRWRNFRPFPPFALFAAFQDDAAVFGHTRPAGLYPMLYQQIRNGRIGHASLTQFHDGIMDGFQTVEWDAMRSRPELLNRLAERFKIGRWCAWCVHNF
jgi:hypothetical protein